MPRLSLTDFVDVVSASGTPKATKVAFAKNRGEYRPEFDFYRALRLHIVDVHRRGLSKSALRSIIGTLTDRKKLKAYPDVIDGHVRWWGRKSLQWFEPATGLFTHGSVDVRVNPELGLVIDETPYLIKIYFKKDALSKNRADIILHLMNVRLTGDSPAGTVMGVLDARNARLHTPTRVVPHIDAILVAEMAYIEAIWPGL